MLSGRRFLKGNGPAGPSVSFGLGTLNIVYSMASEQCEVCGGSGCIVVDARLSLNQCTRCGFLFRSPRPEPDLIASYYSQYDQYDDWLAHEAERDRLWMRRLSIVKRYGRKGRLLDVGAGIGQFLKFARGSFDVEGTEVSSRAIEIAKSKYGLNIRQGTIETIDFGGQRFDVITVFHVLEHVVSPRALLLRCRELLPNEGLLVIAVPNETMVWKLPIKRLRALISVGRFRHFGRYGFEPLIFDRPGLEIHLSHFTTGTLRRLLARCGLSLVDEDVDPCHAVTGFRRLANDVAYHVCRWSRRAAGANFGEAIWMAAVKNTAN